jgi:hypothetical protein
MNNKDSVEVRCPRCGHVFKVDLSALREEQIVYRGEASNDYRVRCPVDHTYFVITIPAAPRTDPS